MKLKKNTLLKCVEIPDLSLSKKFIKLLTSLLTYSVNYNNNGASFNSLLFRTVISGPIHKCRCDFKPYNLAL